MSIAQWDATGAGQVPELPRPGASQGGGSRPLHRLHAVRKQQGVSLRNVARRMHTDMETVSKQEDESSDLPLSVLYAWQQILDVPVADLLVDSDAPLSPAVLQRAQMIKLMKSAVAIFEKAGTLPLQRMVQTLIGQLVDIMPELKDIGPWHAVGQRRTTDEYGRAMERRVADDFFRGG